MLHKGVLREAGTHQELLARARHLLQAVRAAVQDDGQGRRKRTAEVRRGRRSRQSARRVRATRWMLGRSLTARVARSVRRDVLRREATASRAPARLRLRSLEQPLEEARRGRLADSSPGAARSSCTGLPPELQRLVAAPHVDVDPRGPGSSGRCRARCRCRRTCRRGRRSARTEPTGSSAGSAATTPRPAPPRRRR